MLEKLRKRLDWANFLAIASGLAYGFAKYFLSTEGEWGTEPHFLQSHLLHIHIMLVPLLVFVVGMIWAPHIAQHWQRDAGHRRTSGLMLVALFSIITFSGYLIQIAMQEETRTISAWVHGGGSLAWLFIYVWHHWFSRRI